MIGANVRICARLGLAFGVVLLITALMALVENPLKAQVQNTEAVARSGQWMLGFGAALSATISLIFAVLSARSIIQPIQHAVKSAQAISQGDLSLRIQPQGRDETADMMHALRGMQDNLARMVGGVRSSVEGVTTASAGITQGYSDLSARTEQQTSALQETAASMMELSSTVRHNADSAAQANQWALTASAVAVRGSEVVDHVVETVKGIHEASSKFADIISVIDGITFQTNILALNAAVEAARAGEQGRGFAVVGSEVRALAGRSTEAAKEIKTLIDNSVTRAEQGTALVAQAGSTIAEVIAVAANSLRSQAGTLVEVMAVFKWSAERMAGNRAMVLNA